MADNGGPAFPQADNEQAHTNPGMTMLDWFAGQALNAFLPVALRENAFLGAGEGRTLPKWLASDAYDYAVAMIAEKRRREAEDGR